MNNAKTYMRSLSNEDFKASYSKPSPVEGLRKLAVNYKNSKQGQIDFERLRSSIKVPKKPIDPRFRKTRMIATGEGEIIKKPHCQEPVPQQTGTALQVETTSMPTTPTRSPRKKLKIPMVKHTPQKVPDSNSFGDHATMTSSSKESQKASTEDSSVQVDYSQSRLKKADVNEIKNADAKTIINKGFSSVSVQYVDPPPSMVKLPPTDEEAPPETKSINVQSSKPNNSMLEKYYSVPVEIHVKKSKSALALPYSLCPKNMNTRVCMCIKCSCLMRKLDNGDFIGDAPPNQTDAKKLGFYRSTFQKLLKLVLTWGLYVGGLGFGLLIASGFGWLISNDVLWNWVAEPKRQPKPIIYSLVPIFTFCMDIAITTFNFITEAVDTILSLSRNSIIYSITGRPPT